MAEKSRAEKIIGAAGKFCLLALLATVFTAAPFLAASADGGAQCPILQKRSNAMKQPKPNGEARAARPPIDLITPAKTETATFAMG